MYKPSKKVVHIERAGNITRQKCSKEFLRKKTPEIIKYKNRKKIKQYLQTAKKKLYLIKLGLILQITNCYIRYGTNE